MSILKKKQLNFERRRARVRAKVSGTTERPRLSIFKSHRFITVQIIDDTKGHTLAAMSTRDVTGKKPVERAHALGLGIAKKAKAAKIDKVVFDRAGYLYTGKVKVVADAAREGGLTF